MSVVSAHRASRLNRDSGHLPNYVPSFDQLSMQLRGSQAHPVSMRHTVAFDRHPFGTEFLDLLPSKKTPLANSLSDDKKAGFHIPDLKKRKCYSVIRFVRIIKGDPHFMPSANEIKDSAEKTSINPVVFLPRGYFPVRFPKTMEV